MILEVEGTGLIYPQYRNLEPLRFFCLYALNNFNEGGLCAFTRSKAMNVLWEQAFEYRAELKAEYSFE